MTNNNRLLGSCCCPPHVNMLAAWPLNMAALYLTVLGVLGMAFLPVTAWAERPPQVQWASLNLSPQQNQEMDRLETEWRQAYSDITPQLHQDRMALRRLLSSPNPDEQQVMALQARIHTNEARLRQEATRVFLQKKQRLSPEQRSRLNDMMAP